MSVSFLKSLLKERGISAAGCVEKQDLRDRLKGRSDFKKKVASLECRVLENSGALDIELIVVLIHGYGSGFDDMAQVALTMMPRFQNKRIRFVCPQGPTSVQGAGHSWYDVMQVLGQASAMMMSGGQDFSSLVDLHPSGLEESSFALNEMIDELVQETGLSRGSMILCGFSQGATLTLDLALAHGIKENPFRALFMWSGLVLRHTVLMGLAEANFSAPKGKVYVSHGFQDMTVPYMLGRSVQELLKELCEIEVHDFEGAHTVPPHAIESCISEILK